MKKLLLITLLPLLYTACNDFLDKNPDSRTDIDSEEKIAELVVNAYCTRHWGYITEMRSDETDFHGSNYLMHTMLQQELFYWDDVTETHKDSPQDLWNNYYLAIAHSNLALEKIEEFGDTETLAPYKGEALICRAFNHFILVNLFSKHYNPTTSDKDLGVPYMEEVERTPMPDYDRGTVAQVYAKIERDLELALPLIEDYAFKVPKYHFNKVAAYAFASRFYLYKGDFAKVVKYSELAMGNNVAGKVRNWQAVSALTYNGIPRIQEYVDSKLPCNLMIGVYDTYWALVGCRGGYSRYNNNRVIQRTEGRHRSGLWGGSLSDIYLFGTTYLADPRYLTFKLGDQSSRMLIPLFTIEEMLLNRAEAYIRLTHQDGVDRLDLAVDDINMVLSTFSKNGGNVTRQDVNDFYGDGMDYYEWNSPTPKKELDPALGLTGEIELFIHAILHMRRAVFVHEGYRWFDIKRYGIEIYRRQLEDEIPTIQLDFMPRNDERRAFQIPENIIRAGLTPNPR